MSRSPTIRFLFGLLVTLGAVTGLSSYSLYRLHGLRKLELNIIDLNRHDSLQLLRVQNDLNAVGLKLRDMSTDLDGSQLIRYRREFGKLRADLTSALRYEGRLTPITGQRNHKAELEQLLNAFWKDADSVFAQAEMGHRAAARALAAQTLSPRQAELSERVSALLERNNAAEEEADQKISEIYEGAEKDIYLFVCVTILGIAVTSLYLIYWNRKFFWQLESLSHQRRILAARLISVQEEVLRSVSRELHDEFGQILTAVGAMLSRAERKGIPPESPLRTELSEIREITHGTLERIRSLSQMLHPAVIDDYGLAKAVEWYTGVFEKQTGIRTSTIINGEVVRITGQPAIHSFRIVQEALNNAAKHSGTATAEVRMEFNRDMLTTEIQDFGHGMNRFKHRSKGLGLIAMQERAELLDGKLELASSESGTTIRLFVPIRREFATSEEIAAEKGEEVFAEHND